MKKSGILYLLTLWLLISCHYDSMEELILENQLEDSLQNNIPNIEILEPSANASMERPITIRYQLTNWQVAENGKHIQYFIDGENRGFHFGQNSLTISQIDTGIHRIKLVLARYDFSKVNVADSVDVYIEPPPANTFSLVVNNGQGSGNYPDGNQIQVIADDIPGKIFERWEGDVEHLTDATAPSTFLIMPPRPVNLNATYEDEPIDYTTEIAPIIQTECIACHNGVSSPLLSNCQEVSKNAVMVGKKIQDQNDPMPPSGLMSQDKINIILKWIDQGANCN
ncbi:MAG: InlB B-repeat-containing protein [Candidatus Cyclobacteriaceae bacterium M3_2C_046]